MDLSYYQGCHEFLKGLQICYEEFMIWHQRVKRCDKDEKVQRSFSQTFDHHRETPTMSCNSRTRNQ